MSAFISWTRKRFGIRSSEVNMIGFVIAALLLATTASGSEVTMSVTAGAMSSGFARTDYPETETMTGPQIGVCVTTHRDEWGVRTGLELERRGGSWMDDGHGDVWELTSISVPVLLTFRWHVGGFAPELGVGVSGSWLAATSYERVGNGSEFPDFLHEFDPRAVAVFGASMGEAKVRPRVEVRADHGLRSLRAAEVVLPDRRYPEEVYEWSVGLAGGVELGF